MRRSLLAVFLLVAGCAYGAPAATPSPAAASPSVPRSPAPTATAAPTAAATATAGSSAGHSCDPNSYYGCKTAAPSSGTTAAPSATAGTAGDVIVSASAGNLVGPNGLALYTNDNDTATSSTCNVGCVDNWPPLTVSAGQQASGAAGVGGTFATLTRTDGTTQVTYNGKPLYQFVGDTAPGDTSGDGLGGVWHLAQP